MVTSAQAVGGFKGRVPFNWSFIYVKFLIFLVSFKGHVLRVMSRAVSERLIFHHVAMRQQINISALLGLHHSPQLGKQLLSDRSTIFSLLFIVDRIVIVIKVVVQKLDFLRLPHKFRDFTCNTGQYEFVS